MDILVFSQKIVTKLSEMGTQQVGDLRSRIREKFIPDLDPGAVKVTVNSCRL
jgi:hypothetical protein